MADELKHTPGPWLTEPGDTMIGIRAESQQGFYRVADVGGEPYWKKFTPTDEANACLIAAAPDMLAALKNAMASADEDLKQHKSGRTDDCAKAYAMCEAAVAKATQSSVRGGEGT